MSESVVNAGFSGVDRTGEPGSFVRHLDYMTAKGQVQDSKHRSFDALELSPGNTVLDVGCGTGDDARALAALVGREGRVVGVDKSLTMIEEARERSAGLDLAVEYQVGDALALDFADASFDRARMDRVLHHLDDPQRAVSELARVVRPGGRVTLFEPDFDTLIIDHPNRALTRKLVGFFCGSMRNGWAGRRLPAQARRAGFVDLRIVPGTWMSIDFAEARRMAGLDRVIEQAGAAGVVDADEAAAWLIELQAADAEGCFFFATTNFLVERYLHARLSDAAPGFTVTWRLDHAALTEDAQFDGVYCLLTNDTGPAASLHRLFHAYKGQPKVEGRFRAVKSPPIQVRPVWLHQPRRIASLVFVVMVALFVFALIEREARRVVAESGAAFRGVRPDGRDQLPITTPVLFEAFGSLTLLTQSLRVGDEVHDLVVPTSLTGVQLAILDRLGLEKPDAYLHPVIIPHPA